MRSHSPSISIAKGASKGGEVRNAISSGEGAEGAGRCAADATSSLREGADVSGARTDDETSLRLR